MREYVLENGVKLLYKYRSGVLTSLCVGFNAGALEEIGQFDFGTAHALEHVIYKGTRHRNEKQINDELDSVFGFENAMTNYPYTIYYGTCFSEDFERALELYSDVLLNPVFPEEGFGEEMDVILQERKDWEDDLYRRCEDVLFENSFEKRRIRELIVGNEKSIKNIDLEEIKRFYSTFYFPGNCTMCFCSSLDFKSIISIVCRYFEKWKGMPLSCSAKLPLYEKNKAGVFVEKVPGDAGAKIQYIFDIHDLDEREFKALCLFNAVFGQGNGSLLFSRLRTDEGIAYDLGSTIRDERGVKLFSIRMSTLPEHIDSALDIIDGAVEKSKRLKGYFSGDRIKRIGRSLKLKREIKREKSVEYCKEIVEWELMYRRFHDCCNSCSEVRWDEIDDADIVRAVNKALRNPSVQILSSIDD